METTVGFFTELRHAGVGIGIPKYHICAKVGDFIYVLALFEVSSESFGRCRVEKLMREYVSVVALLA